MPEISAVSFVTAYPGSDSCSIPAVFSSLSSGGLFLNGHQIFHLLNFLVSPGVTPFLPLLPLPFRNGNVSSPPSSCQCVPGSRLVFPELLEHPSADQGHGDVSTLAHQPLMALPLLPVHPRGSDLPRMQGKHTGRCSAGGPQL